MLQPFEFAIIYILELSFSLKNVKSGGRISSTLYAGIDLRIHHFKGNQLAMLDENQSGKALALAYYWHKFRTSIQFSD